MYLRTELADHSPRSKLGREAKRLLAIAERYEDAYQRARDAAGLPAAIEARRFAGHDLETAALSLRDLPVSSAAGVAIKARAIVACAKVGGVEKYRALLQIGPVLADDIVQLSAKEGGAS